MPTCARPGPSDGHQRHRHAQRLGRLCAQLRRTKGAIVNTASIAAYVATGPRSAIPLDGGGRLLTQNLAQELAKDGVRVNALAPGPFVTAMTAPTRENPERSAAFLGRIPLGRFGEPDELVGRCCSSSRRWRATSPARRSSSMAAISRSDEHGEHHADCQHPPSIETDVLVVGSGAGGLSAAVTAAHHGLEVIVAEKAAVYGGTRRARRWLWVPGNPLAERAGIADTREAAAVSPARGRQPLQRRPVDAFLDNARAWSNSSRPTRR